LSLFLEERHFASNIHLLFRLSGYIYPFSSISRYSLKHLPYLLFFFLSGIPCKIHFFFFLFSCFTSIFSSGSPPPRRRRDDPSFYIQHSTAVWPRGSLPTPWLAHRRICIVRTTREKLGLYFPLAAFRYPNLPRFIFSSSSISSSLIWFLTRYPFSGFL